MRGRTSKSRLNLLEETPKLSLISRNPSSWGTERYLKTVERKREGEEAELFSSAGTKLGFDPSHVKLSLEIIQ